jgi:hypothetical protein
MIVRSKIHESHHISMKVPKIYILSEVLAGFLVSVAPLVC